MSADSQQDRSPKMVHQRHCCSPDSKKPRQLESIGAFHLLIPSNASCCNQRSGRCRHSIDCAQSRASLFQALSERPVGKIIPVTMALQAFSCTVLIAAFYTAILRDCSPGGVPSIARVAGQLRAPLLDTSVNVHSMRGIPNCRAANERASVE